MPSLETLDRVCDQLAIAMQNSAGEIYLTLAFVLVLSALLFPPRDDPDQL